MEKFKFLTSLSGRIILGQGRLAGMIAPPPLFFLFLNKISIHGSKRKGDLLKFIVQKAIQ